MFLDRTDDTWVYCLAWLLLGFWDSNQRLHVSVESTLTNGATSPAPFLCSETRSHCVDRAGLGIAAILLPLPPERWD